MPGRVDPILDGDVQPDQALEDDDDGAHRPCAQRLQTMRPAPPAAN